MLPRVSAGAVQENKAEFDAPLGGTVQGRLKAPKVIRYLREVPIRSVVGVPADRKLAQMVEKIGNRLEPKVGGMPGKCLTLEIIVESERRQTTRPYAIGQSVELLAVASDGMPVEITLRFAE